MTAADVQPHVSYRSMLY